MASNDLISIKDWIRWGAAKLNQAGVFLGHGTDEVFSEARALILHALCLPPDTPDFYLDSRITKKEPQAIKDIIKLRIESRKPAAYLTNQAWFAGFEFYVDERVLVPRSPIAELIENNFAPWLDFNKTQNILDLCTGSACIAVALSYAFQHAAIDAADISDKALQVARINIDKHGLQEKIQLFQSDLFNALPAKKYDLIVSNPPYVDAEDLKNMPREFQHEPMIGLAGGMDGLLLVERIIKDSASYLKPHGILVVEVGNSKQALIEKFPQLDFVWLEFNYGGEGVFLLKYQQIREAFYDGNYNT